MCGVTGRISFTGANVIPDILEDLIRSQHRGNGNVGFVIGDSSNQLPYSPWKKRGSAGSNFGKESSTKAEELVNRYRGDVGIGTVCHAISEQSNASIQPHGFKHGGQSVVLASNGGIPFCDDERARLGRLGCRFASQCDAEVVVNLVGWQIYNEGKNVLEAFAHVGEMLKAAFSLVAITPDGKLLAMRDPWGIRPLFVATNEHGGMVASESAIVSPKRFTRMDEVDPGTIVIISSDGTVECERFTPMSRRSCLMEVYYFASPASLFRGRKLGHIRRLLGAQAGEEWLAKGYPVPDVVSPVPFSGIPAAEGCAHVLGSQLRTVIVKERFGGRIFPQTGASRASLLEEIFSVSGDEVRGKTVMLVDDSIVRGDQILVLGRMLREAGATHVYFIATAPPYRYPCFLGINTPDPDLLIAHGRNEEEILKMAEVDILHHLSLPGAFDVLGGNDFCSGCFTVEYPVPVPERGKEV